MPQSGGDARGSLGVDTLSPGSTATLAPGPSPIMTSGGFPGGQVGLMNQHMSGAPSVGGQHMNGGTSPVTTPTSAGGMMANGLQGMGVVTTYPPRRKAIRAAQVRYYFFWLELCAPTIAEFWFSVAAVPEIWKIFFFSDSYGWVAHRATCSRF